MKQTQLVTLRRITLALPEDVDFIRETRNSFIGKGVYVDEHWIEREEHWQWFATLDEKRDFFFSILTRGKQVPSGFVGCYQKRAPAGSGEISIYLAEPGTSPLVPFHAMALLLEFMFRELHLQRAYGAFLPQNQRAIRFNSSFGFRPFEEKDGMLYTELSAGEYESSRNKFQRFLNE